MSSKTAKAIFYVGTLSSAVLFLVLTWDTHRQVQVLTNADRLDENVVAGKRVFQKYNCNDCHTILGFGGYYAPDLTRVYSRRGEAYIRKALTEPEVLFASSFRKMPQQHLQAEELSHLVAFFTWVNEINTNDWPPQDSKKRRLSETGRLLGGTDISPGAALFKANGCFECHSLGGVGATTAQGLDQVGARLSAATIETIITNPRAVKPDGEMPAFPDLTVEQVKQIADFLSRQTGGAL